MGTLRCVLLPLPSCSAVLVAARSLPAALPRGLPSLASLGRPLVGWSACGRWALLPLLLLALEVSMLASTSAVVAAVRPFVPSAEALGALRVVPVPGLARGGSVESSVVSVGADGVSVLSVWFVGRPLPLRCRADRVPSGSFDVLVSAVADAGRAGVPVFPVVAVFGSAPASGFFCGFALESLAGAAPSRPSAGSFA